MTGPPITDLRVTFKQKKTGKPVPLTQIMVKLPLSEIAGGEYYSSDFKRKIESAHLEMNGDFPKMEKVEYIGHYSNAIAPPVPKSIEGFWSEHIQTQSTRQYMSQIKSTVTSDRKKGKVYPHPRNVFSAFRLCPYERTKVVMIGQDPYHTPGVADGMAFSSGIKTYVPPSLKVIMKEIKDDYCKGSPEAFYFEHPSLAYWAVQGVMLLNSALTVKEGQAKSHAHIGWKIFVQSCIVELMKKENLVWILWGRDAKDLFEETINTGMFDQEGTCKLNKNHLVLKAPHPVTESYNPGEGGFYGCKHFTKTNEYLRSKKLETIKWCIYN